MSGDAFNLPAIAPAAPGEIPDGIMNLILSLVTASGQDSKGVLKPFVIDPNEHKTHLLVDTRKLPDGTEETISYLKAAGRVEAFWDQTRANGQKGQILTFPLGSKQMGESTYECYAMALVLVDGAILSIGYAKSTNVGSAYDPYETSQTKAAGRALGLAGFNIRDGRLDEFEKEEGLDGHLADAPVAIPFSGPTLEKPAAASAPAQAAAPAQAVQQPSEEDLLKQAFALVVPIGTEKGKTLGDLNVTNPWWIQYYAGLLPDRQFGSAARYPELVKACLLISDYNSRLS